MKYHILASSDKLSEAEFFFEKLKENKGKFPEMYFFLSAFLSAARSVSLVLQKDLRHKYGNDFESWWEKQKIKYDGTLHLFMTIRDLRNIFQKEGNTLPMRLHFELPNDDTHIIFMDYDLNLHRAKSWGLKYKKKFKIPVKSNNVEKDISEALENRYPNLSEFVSNFIKNGNPQLIGVTYGNSRTIKKFSDLLNDFEKYLFIMREVINAATIRFI